MFVGRGDDIEIDHHQILVQVIENELSLRTPIEYCPNNSINTNSISLTQMQLIENNDNEIPQASSRWSVHPDEKKMRIPYILTHAGIEVIGEPGPAQIG
jgi:hypothetical protein